MSVKEKENIYKNGEKYVCKINVKNFKFDGEGTLYHGINYIH